MAARRIVLHADDVGMCHGANAAFVELSRLGSISAGSVMVPCPWFAEIAESAAADPALDVGVHLTLNSEHRGYRWGPLTAPTRGAGLTDGSGYFWPTVAEVRRHAHPDAVEAEWRAQIDRALEAGIDVTHLDTHMGSALAPEWCERYLALADDYGVPTLITASLAAYGPNTHLDDVTEDEFSDFVALADATYVPVFDQVLETDFGRPRGAPVDHASLLSGADGELVYCAFHPCRPGPGEIEHIEPDAYHVRTDEYREFSRREWVDWLSDQDVEVIGMRALRDEFRAANA